MAARPDVAAALECGQGSIAPWGAVLSQNAAKYAIIDLGQAATSWGEYRKRVKSGLRSGRHVGFPRFKRRRHEQGFRADNGPDTVRVDGKVVTLPKIGTVVMVEHLRFRGSIREVTVNRTAETWFACFCIEDGQQAPPVKPGPTIGLDVGVGTMAVCSDGTRVENPKALATGLKRLRRLDKAIARSRNVPGRSSHSNRREPEASVSASLVVGHHAVADEAGDAHAALCVAFLTAGESSWTTPAAGRQPSEQELGCLRFLPLSSAMFSRVMGIARYYLLLFIR